MRDVDVDIMFMRVELWLDAYVANVMRVPKSGYAVERKSIEESLSFLGRGNLALPPPTLKSSC